MIIKTRPGTVDGWVVAEVESGVYTKLFPLLSSDIVADVGAHIGAFSVLAAQTAFHVYSFEPQPENYSILLENLKLNNVTNDTPMNVAVADAPGETWISSQLPINTGILEIGHGDVQVRVVTLDQTIKTRLDFLKVDVEGSELKVLQGAQALLSNNKVRIAIEVHSRELQMQITEFLHRLGYVVVIRGPDLGELPLLYSWNP